MLILTFGLVMISPAGDILLQAIVNNNELVLTFLILIIFKLLNPRISKLVDTTNEKVRENYAKIFLIFLGLLLFFTKDQSWWGYEMNSFVSTLLAILCFAYPIIAIKKALERKNDESDEVN